MTNTGGTQTKSTAIIGVSRGQGQLTQVIDNYTVIYVHKKPPKNIMLKSHTCNFRVIDQIIKKKKNLAVRKA